ncbi:hypothetical protein [Sphingobium yanoikuyae]|uniref:hypothetical protein n=1 Tax=Sphingobium yanoikuyae TaxID=13690 RepID=UPI0028AAAC21|nr:hypothetical protein [Sphingobium yanoikuyae]
MASLPVTASDATPLAAQTEEGRFALRQRQARMFAMSPLIPEHLRKGPPEVAMSNCYIALTLAEAMGEVPLIVMQNIHVVNGKAGFASQYMIARANSSGVFKGRIDWRIDRSNPQNLSVTAFAFLKETGDEVSVTCDMAMAVAEGWTKNPKYKSMPEVMLRYRSAAFLVRFYAPDVMLGYQTVEEVSDVAMAVEPAAPLSAAMLAAPVEEDAEQVDGTQPVAGELALEGPDQSQQGEENNGSAFDAAVAEIDRCPTADAIDSALARLRPMMETDEDADDLFSHAETVKAQRWGGAA